MENQSNTKSYLLSFSIFIGLTLLGFFIFKGLKTFSDKDRVVTVKGLAEINITANTASMTLNFSFSGDNLQELIKQTEAKKNSIILNLTSLNYDKQDIIISNIDIIDKEKYYSSIWQNGKEIQQKIDRYKITQTLQIVVKDVKLAEEKASKLKLDLISKGLTSTITTNYTFPELNSVKPKLIAESTKNARVAGEQFANDSKATLGKIKTASQGQISIAGQNQYNYEDAIPETPITTPPYIQTARVVSTIVFFLE